MASSDRFECRFQICEGLHTVDLAGLDQRGDAAPRAPTFIVPCEQRVLTTQGNRANEIFDAVGVDLDTSVGQEGLQSAPVAMDVSQFLAEA